MIERELYMKQIQPYIGKPFIKVLTGIRRCGKSSILTLLRNKILSLGVHSENIVHINFENMDFADVDNAKKLHACVTNLMRNEAMYYLLFDEIQEVDEWERAINSLVSLPNVDIYITGSNSRLLSSELATYIAGRYVEINVKTLSFREYLLFRETLTGKASGDTRGDFKKFIRTGGFPAINTSDYEYEAAYRIVKDIHASALLRDTVQRHGIRNIDLLDRLIKYVFDNLGNTFSGKNVADYFRSQHRKLDADTVYNYLNALESAFIITRTRRYDIKGREILKTMEKFYVADQSLIYAAMGYKERMISGILENIVMHELERRGYDVYIGKLDDKEIDFIAERRGEKIYVQVTYLLGDSTTINREFAPLAAVRDNYPKYVLSMDDLWNGNIEGIRHMHAADFLLKEDDGA
ncbi:MAG: ATP-binding protein [Synergistaceae bacterium]|jgi:predicted AAA+ superfamily ATPase|nr:ATP-binding protein [Synergistaceae bacterium]